jgi:hypothetical protein
LAVRFAAPFRAAVPRDVDFFFFAAPARLLPALARLPAARRAVAAFRLAIS